MTVESYDQLAIFSVVAQERSFTRAAARLGMSQPALSRAMRQLEERLGVRLLARTTRSVAPTPAGEHLLQVIAPRFDDINPELALPGRFDFSFVLVFLAPLFVIALFHDLTSAERESGRWRTLAAS